MRVTDSILTVRGNLTDTLSGGLQGWQGTRHGKLYNATGSTLVASGVKYGIGATSLVNSVLLQPAISEPFVETGGTDVPEGNRTVSLCGPVGEAALLVGSFSPGLFTLGVYEGALWFSPTAPVVLVPLVLTGQELPLVLDASLPASLAGLEGTSYEVQAFFPGIAGAQDPSKALAGNVAELILRF